MIGKAVAGPSTPPRVLVVEDEPEMRDLLADNLELEGYRVAAVGSAEEALQRIDRHAFALILLDVMLPQASGFELCRTVRARYRAVGAVYVSDTLHAVSPACTAGAWPYQQENR